ncbi:MAG: D-hexose-6-phosphate mutarotase [Acidobacteria bacterium]|nr:D-hexose-6-phosphate mutarotase [Acidobacteriota bacterium]
MTTLAAQLDGQYGIPGLAQIAEGHGGLPCVRVSGAWGTGEVYLYGAHVTSWKPKGFEDALFLSSRAHWQEGQAIRGGVPICFPWFRNKADDAKAPAHGFVRTRLWQLASIAERDGGTVVTLFTQSDEHTRRWWPGEFRLEHRVSFGPELRMELVCRNTGASPFRYEEALHTYNRVTNAAQARVGGLEGVHFLDNTDANREKVQGGAIEFSAQTDRAYRNTSGRVDVIDPGAGRRIRLTKQGSRNTVVWNPWQEKAAAIADLGDGEWAQFLCVEACNMLEAAVSLAPGEEHVMAAALSVTKLEDTTER